MGMKRVPEKDMRMQTTVHDTPVLRNLMRWLAMIFFRLAGWKEEGQRPDIPKYVIIAAPHTSNWDFVYTMCLAFILRIKPLVMMKGEWFRWPLGFLFRWLGALPVDRAKSQNIVAQSIEAFRAHPHMVMVVPPSGTRKQVTYWKTGFYHIAQGAGVPIVLGYLDYRRKAGGIGPLLHTTGNIHADMAVIRAFYADITGKNPKKASRPLVLAE
jgi:1-acyl-sn-glycerol-3-phosphate acyltransferase